jgi:hypothetical protein
VVRQGVLCSPSACLFPALLLSSCSFQSCHGENLDLELMRLFRSQITRVPVRISLTSARAHFLSLSLSLFLFLSLSFSLSLARLLAISLIRWAHGAYARVLSLPLSHSVSFLSLTLSRALTLCCLSLLCSVLSCSLLSSLFLFSLSLSPPLSLCSLRILFCTFQGPFRDNPVLRTSANECHFSVLPIL